MIYEISLWRRTMDIRRNKSCKGMMKYSPVEGFGVCIVYDTENQLREEDLSKGICHKTKAKCFVEADDPSGSIEKFYKEYEGARVGGKEEKAKAIYIDYESFILELPDCLSLIKKDNEYYCGDEVNQKISKLCVIEENTAPRTKCLISSFYERLKSFKSDWIPRSIFNGFMFIRAKEIMQFELLNTSG